MALVKNSGGGSSGGVGGLSLVSKTVLASPGTFSLSALPQTFADLEIRFLIRGTAAAASDLLKVQLNGDSGANYSSQFMSASGAGPTGGESFANASWAVAQIASASANASYFTSVILQLFGYASTNWFKMARMSQTMALGVTTTNMQVTEFALQWIQTAAITSVTAAGNATANLATNSEVWVYGRGAL